MKRFTTVLLMLVMMFSFTVPTFAAKTYFDFPKPPMDKGLYNTWAFIEVPMLGYFDLESDDSMANAIDKGIMYYSNKYSVDYEMLDFIVLFSMDKDIRVAPRIDNSVRKEVGISGMTQKEFKDFISKTYKIKKWNSKYERDIFFNIEARAYTLGNIWDEANTAGQEPILAQLESFNLDQGEWEEPIDIRYMFDQYIHECGGGTHMCINDFAMFGDPDEGYDMGCYDLYDPEVDGVGFIGSQICMQ